MNLKSQDYLAKLLAKENLSVHHGNFSTASFDIEARILNLPLWADKGKDVYDLLVGHEVGHALYTPVDGWHDSDKEIPGIPRSMINIIEDIRIEKKIQNTYPGIIRAFKSGYKKLFDDNLFGTVDKDLADYNFMDRLNIMSKGRGYAPVKFDDTEQMFVDLAMAVDTWEDVLNACVEINDYLLNKESYDDDEETDNKISAGTDEDEPEFEDSPSDSKDVSEPQGDTEPNEATESLTDDAQRENEEDLLETLEDGSQPMYSSGISDSDISKMVIPYTTLKEARLKVTGGVYSDIGLPEAFKQQCIGDGDIMKTVNLMAREFERKKAAWEYSRSSEAKKGSLNVNKIHQYKYSEDIFLSVQKLAEAKNHGIFMIIDWSGSMHGILDDVIKQTITIALFCKRVNIPFEAYTFTSGYNSNEASAVGNEIEGTEHVRVVQVISSTLKRKAFDEALIHLWGSAQTRTAGYGSPFYYNSVSDLDKTGGTPFIQSLMALAPVINKFRAKNSIQNSNIMILTDGIADSVRINKQHELPEYVNSSQVVLKFGNTTITASTRQGLAEATVKALGKITSSKVLGFFLTSNKHDFYSASYICELSDLEQEKMKAFSTWKKEGVVSYNKRNGYDEFFIVKVGGKAAPTEFEVTAKGDKVVEIKDIKREFRKFAKRGSQSKQLVNKITSAVAA
jgi:hypothetical protein